jgi:hypothetical protein
VYSTHFNILRTPQLCLSFDAQVGCLVLGFSFDLILTQSQAGGSIKLVLNNIKINLRLTPAQTVTPKYLTALTHKISSEPSFIGDTMYT